jgi:hypothetical protein
MISCTQNQQANDSNQNQTTDSSTAQAAATVINFYKWYRSHRSIQGCLVNNACGQAPDSTKFYSVNFEATEHYLAILKQSGFVSDVYLATQRTRFKESDQNFKKYPVYDGPPEGFDYDFIMNAQDFETELNTVEKATVSEASGSDAAKKITLRFTTGTYLSFDLSRIRNTWYINKIY